MIRHILVPLDGSALAESVLPAVAALAADFQARVTLFHVIERGAPDTVHGQSHLTEAEAAQAYLEAVARRPLFQDREVDVHVHRSQAENVAASVVDHAQEFGADLIILATHGPRGLRRFFLGRVALRAVQRGTTPVLLINPTAEGKPPPFTIRTILIPLDGSSAHEPSVPVAMQLAKACRAAVHLVMVVPTAGTLSGHAKAAAALLPLAAREFLDLAHREAAAYVHGMAGSLTAQGIAAKSYVSRGDPVGALVEAAKTLNADLVIMATHGKGALDAFWSGSLTPKVMEALDRPLLLVRAAADADPSD